MLKAQELLRELEALRDGCASWRFDPEMARVAWQRGCGFSMRWCILRGSSTSLTSVFVAHESIG